RNASGMSGQRPAWADPFGALVPVGDTAAVQRAHDPDEVDRGRYGEPVDRQTDRVDDVLAGCGVRREEDVHRTARGKYRGQRDARDRPATGRRPVAELGAQQVIADDAID